MLSTKTTDDNQKVVDASKSIESKLEIRVKNTLIEFFKVQRIYHFKIKNLVETLEENRKLLRKEMHFDLDKLITPYRLQVENPFPEYSSGDITQDILDIFNVITKRDRKFTKVYAGQMASALYLKESIKFLEKFRTEKLLLESIKTHLATKVIVQSEDKEVDASIQQNVVSELQSRLSLPFQNLPRYKLLMKSLLDVLSKMELLSDKPDPELLQSRSQVEEIIQSLEDDFKLLDEYYDLGQLVQEISGLKQLYENMPYADESDLNANVPLILKPFAVTEYIINSMILVASGDFDIFSVNKGLLELLEQLYVGMPESLARERKEAWDRGSFSYRLYSVSNDAYNLVFGIKDPRERLGEYLAKLRDETSKAERLQIMVSLSRALRVNGVTSLAAEIEPKMSDAIAEVTGGVSGVIDAVADSSEIVIPPAPPPPPPYKFPKR